MNLNDALRSCTLALLRKIAIHHSLPVVDAALRGELAQAIAERLAQSDYQKSFLLGCSQKEAELLRMVARAGWRQKAFLLERLSNDGGSRSESETRGSDLSPLTSLAQKGILFRSYMAIGGWRGETYCIPEEWRPEIAMAFPIADEPARLQIVSEADPAIIHDPHPAHDLFCLLSFLRRGNRRYTQGSLARGDLLKLDQEAWEPSAALAPGSWEEKWRFLTHLGLASGWLKRQGNLLRPGRRAVEALSGPHQAVAGRLLQSYLRDWGWSDLRIAGRVRQALGNRRIDEVSARGVLLHYLAELAGHGWTDEGAFRTALRSANPDFLREDYASPSWGIIDVSSGTELFGPDCWDIVEGEWVGYVLRGPLHWLGVVRWGTTRDGTAMAFQFRPTGDVAGASSFGRAGGSGISVTQDMRLEVDGAVDLGLLYRLEPYLEARRYQGRTHYRLTRESVVSGLEHGGSWEELSEMLPTQSPELVPPAVSAQLKEWVADFGRYVVEPGILLQLADAGDGEEVKSIPGLMACLHSRLGPTSFLVIPERVWELVQALKGAGHSPRVDGTIRHERARAAAADIDLLKECLFALKLLRSLHPDLYGEKGAEAVRIMESRLDPVDNREVSRRAEDAVRKAAGRPEP